MYKPCAKIDIKSGNSFSLICSYTDEAGALLPIDNTQIIAEIKDSGRTLIATMVVNILDANSFELALPLGVVLNPGQYYTDVRMVTDGTVRNSDTMQLNVAEVVTNGTT